MQILHKNPEASTRDIARDLGFDPLNTLPEDQYETGTGLTKPGTAILHGTEAVIGQNEQEDLLGSYRESIDLIGSNLVSVSVALILKPFAK